MQVEVSRKIGTPTLSPFLPFPERERETEQLITNISSPAGKVGLEAAKECRVLPRDYTDRGQEMTLWQFKTIGATLDTEQQTTTNMFLGDERERGVICQSQENTRQKILRKSGK